MHNSSKMSCKPGGTWIKKQHFFSLTNTGLIIEEHMWGIIVSTKEHVYYLGEEGNQFSMEQKGGK